MISVMSNLSYYVKYYNFRQHQNFIQLNISLSEVMYAGITIEGERKTKPRRLISEKTWF